MFVVLFMLVVAKIKNNNKEVNKKSIHINNSLNGEPSDLLLLSLRCQCLITIMLLLEREGDGRLWQR